MTDGAPGLTGVRWFGFHHPPHRTVATPRWRPLLDMAAAD
jgi:hypothetical protein